LGLVKIVRGWIRGEVGLRVGKIGVDVKFFVSGAKKFDIEDDNGWVNIRVCRRQYPLAFYTVHAQPFIPTCF